MAKPKKKSRTKINLKVDSDNKRVETTDASHDSRNEIHCPAKNIKCVYEEYEKDAATIEWEQIMGISEQKSNNDKSESQVQSDDFTDNPLIMDIQDLMHKGSND